MSQKMKTHMAMRSSKRQGDRNDFFTAVGIPSLITVLVVMLLGCFAVLSLITARTDGRLAKKASEAASEYYLADFAATEKLAELKKLIAAGADPAEYGFDVIQTIDYGELICYNMPIDKNNSLYVELTHTGDAISIVKWQTAATAQTS